MLDDGIYIEDVGQDTTANRYTNDNSIYTPGKEFIFDYLIIRRDQRLKIATPLNVDPAQDFQRAWSFVDAGQNTSDKIENISLQILSGMSNENQTKTSYNYYGPWEIPCSFRSTSGIIENKKNIWIHPHRDKYFMILELNPFPFIQQPFQVGNKWNWKLDIGDHWSDDRWFIWDGTITNSYDYEIVSQETINTSLGRLPCWVVSGTARSKLGTTKLLAYFNESSGFVKLDYTNIDDSEIHLDIKQIKSFK